MTTICPKDGKRCYIHYTKDKLFEHHCRHGDCVIGFPCEVSRMGLADARAMLRFLTWEKNRHKHDVDVITADIEIIIKRYPKLAKFAEKIKDECYFIQAKDI